MTLGGTAFGGVLSRPQAASLPRHQNEVRRPSDGHLAPTPRVSDKLFWFFRPGSGAQEQGLDIRTARGVCDLILFATVTLPFASTPAGSAEVRTGGRGALDGPFAKPSAASVDEGCAKAICAFLTASPGAGRYPIWLLP